MKRRCIILLSFFLVNAPGYPCGNSFRRSVHAEEYQKGSSLETFRFKRGFDHAALVAELNSIADAISDRFSLFENENDKALTYMRMGRYAEATTILEKLAKEKPGEYNIVANLGTLYELKGENEKALEYIRKAIAINAASHHGSEWVHVKILEAKLLNKNADWWKTHPVLDITRVQKTPEIIISDITYQLKERLPFTKAPDALMASILHETGDYLQQQNKNGQAWILYKIAEEYDKEQLFPLQSKTEMLEKKLAAAGIPLPDYRSHFTGNATLAESGKDLVEKGIGMYNRYQEREKEKLRKEKNQKTIFMLATGALVAVLAVFIYVQFRRKKTG